MCSPSLVENLAEIALSKSRNRLPRSNPLPLIRKVSSLVSGIAEVDGVASQGDCKSKTWCMVSTGHLKQLQGQCLKNRKTEVMRIGELARTAQCSVETIRYYEKEGLLPKPARSVNNYRIYGSNHLRRLLFVRNCRGLDISQKEVHALLGLMESAEHDCSSVIAVMDEHISHVDKRIGELRRLRDQLIDLRRKCRGQSKMRNCRILRRLSAMRIAGTVVSHPATEINFTESIPPVFRSQPNTPTRTRGRTPSTSGR
jgi:Cd(II)/Pb(II)-responsive transcriptional regulator